MIDQRVFTAEKQIAAILAQLEIDTQSIVESMSVRSLDQTSIQHPRMQLMRQVVIELKPVPGSRWA